MKAFIATKVDTEAAQARSADILKALEAARYAVFLPKKRPATAIEILESNEREVDAADLVVCVFDGAGAGVGMELGRADALKKDIVGFRTPESAADEYLGKMLEGFWQRLPEDRKAQDLARLEQVLAGLKTKTISAEFA
jgi:nucleoside 2-deoxyribosyltransferase